MENITHLFRANPLYFTSGVLDIYHESYEVLKHTPKGVWIKMPSGSFQDKKFVLLSGRKRFAYPTKKEALTALLYRKKRQIIILKNQLEQAENVVNKITAGHYIEYDDDDSFKLTS